MDGRNYADIVTGAGLTLFGGAVAGYALANYNVGTFSSMGPGMFPAGVGVIIAGFGIAIVATGLMSQGAPVTFKVRPTLAVLGALALFALMVETLGMVPAIVGMTCTSVLASEKPTVGRALVLAVVLSAVAYAIFAVGLGMPIRAFRWPL